MFLITGCMVFICSLGEAVNQTTQAPKLQFTTTAADTNSTVNPTNSSSSWLGSNSTCDCWSLTQIKEGLQNSTSTLLGNCSEEYKRCNNSLLSTKTPTALPPAMSTPGSNTPPSTSESPTLSNNSFGAEKNQLSNDSKPDSTARTVGFSNTEANSTEQVPITTTVGGATTDRQVVMVTRKDHVDQTDDVLKTTVVPTCAGSQFTTSTAAPTLPVQPKQITVKNLEIITVDIEDYHYYDSETSHEAEKIREILSKKCSYDPCTHLQKPCTEIFDNCLCPGQSPASERPGTPPMSLGEVTHNSVQVVWCAPASHVEKYRLEVQQEGGGLLLTQSVDSVFRRATMFSLLGGRTYNICLTAENQAGSSPQVCTAFSTRVNSNHYLFAVASLAGVLLVATSVLSMLLYKQCKKPPLRSPHLTSLISIPNPAFCSPEDRMGSSTSIFKI